MLRKIRRIFLKSSGILLLSLILLLGLVLLGIQTFTFQTWLGHQASDYFSSELNTQVQIGKIELKFFEKAHLRKVLILDQKNDTLLSGDILVDMSGLRYRQQKVNLDKIVLSNLTAKIRKYKTDSVFNYQFLLDYFSSGKSDTTAKKGWAVKLGDIQLQNVHLLYQRQKFVEAPSHMINFDDVELFGTSGTIRDFKMNGDTLNAEIIDLQTKEKSGFHLLALNTKASISSKFIRCDELKIKTDKSKITGALLFKSNSWDDYSDFINRVNMSGTLEDSTQVSFDDISVFASELNGLKEVVAISGQVNGTVSDLKIKNLNLQYGKNTGFRGQVHMTGLPDINATYLHFDAKELSTNYEDLVQLPSYPFTNGEKLQLPEALKPLGTVSYRGKFDGFISDFTTYGTFKTALGIVRTDLSIQIPEKSENIKYHGKLSTENFDLGTLLAQSDLNHLSMSAEITGEGIDPQTMETEAQGSISNILFHGYNYNNIVLNGSFSKKLFNGYVSCKDPNADFDFNGTINFEEKIPQMDFISTLNNINLYALHFVSAVDSGALSSQILINLKGSNIDNLNGTVNFDNTIYKTAEKNFKLSTFDIQAEQNTADKKIRLSSEYLNATALGNFQVANLQPAIEQMLYHYYPSYFKKLLKERVFKDRLELYVKIKKFNTIRDLFLPNIMLAPNTVLESKLDAESNTLNLQLNSPFAQYRDFELRDFNFILNENNQEVIAELSSRSFKISDSLHLENLNFGVSSMDTITLYKADWDNLRIPANKGDIQGRLVYGASGFDMRNQKLNITLQDTAWTQTQAGRFLIQKNGDLLVDPFTITTNSQQFSLAGALTASTADTLNVQLSNVILEQFNGLLRAFNLKMEGVADGRLSINNDGAIKAYNGFLKLKQFKLNDNTIGELVVNSKYHSTENSVSLDGYTSLGISDEFGNPTKNISFKGTIDFDKKEESIDIDFAAKPANLSLLNPFLTDIITIKNGFINGAGKIHGSPKNILIDGKFRLFNSDIKVDYTNVSYAITGDIEVMSDQIRFSDLLMREKGSKSAPTGTINGNVFHRNFTDWQLDYDISYRNMLVLNTSEKDNSLYYGKLYGTGNVGIYGYINKLHMVIENTTNKNSKFILPLDGPAEIGENDFIHFVKHDTLSKNEKKALNGFDLDMVVHATPDAQMQIIIDKKSGDMLNVQGRGDLHLNINTLGKFEMVGDYIISEGDYLFTLENVINKKFDIESGSSISWSGDPLNAEIDIVTNYRQRASVAPLLNDTTGNYKTRTPVDCKLIITDKLFSPSINFQIDFPNLDGTSKSRIASVLSDETELNRQVFSFLLFRTFATPLIYNTNGGGVTAGGAAANTGSELLSNRVSEFLNTYFGSLSGIKDLQLGLNYRPGTGNSNETVDLALSKQFLDNKVSVDGNFGVNQNATNGNSLIGDVNVDYKLTNDGRFRLKGFNRSNDNTQITTAGGPYTQGVGFFYRVEFNSLNELWRSFKAKTKKKPATTDSGK